MKKLTYCLGILLIVLGGFFQSCDDGGYSIGDIAVDWATIDAKDAHAYSLVGDRWGLFGLLQPPFLGMLQ